MSFFWNEAFTQLNVVFDKPLVDQPLDAANWDIEDSLGGHHAMMSASIVTPDQVMLRVAGPAVPDAIDVVYAATPPDVVGTNGFDVIAFRFPLV